jgi:hypothetical protein
MTFKSVLQLHSILYIHIYIYIKCHFIFYNAIFVVFCLIIENRNSGSKHEITCPKMECDLHHKPREHCKIESYFLYCPNICLIGDCEFKFCLWKLLSIWPICGRCTSDLSLCRCWCMCDSPVWRSTVLFFPIRDFSTMCS